MIALLTHASLVFGLLGQAPSIDRVEPAPLPRGASAQIVGAGFAAGGTAVAIDDVAQVVAFVDATHVIFTVASDAPLGAATLKVTVAGESATTAVEVVTPAPSIDDVSPEPVVLGGLATVQGSALDTVTSVTLDGAPCEVTEHTAIVLVFRVPFDATLLGSSLLSVTSPSGTDAATVDVIAPPPVIDAITPNPARASTLVTVRGTILPLAPAVAVGGIEAPIVTAASDRLVIWLPPELAAGPHEVTVTAASLASAPAGPLFVQAADAKAPRVTAVYPARVAAGGTLWIIGEDLDGVTSVVPALSIVQCQRRACRLSTEGLEAGLPFTAAVDGPRGAAVFGVEVTGEAPEVATVARIEPSPAIRGQSLAIYGTRIVTVRSVILGGRAQTIDFFDAEKVVVTVDEDTPLGAQTLFLATNVGSEPFPATVLDPLPGVEEDAAVEVAEPGPEAAAEAVAEPIGADVEAPVKRADDGCGGGGRGEAGGLGGALALALVALAVARAPDRVTCRRGPSPRPGPGRG